MPMDVFTGVVVVLAVLVVVWLAFVLVLWLHRPSRNLAGPAVRLVPDVLRLTRRLLADGATPRGVRVVLAGLVVYLVSPIDVLPEFLPVVGPLGDVIVATLVLGWVGRRLGPERLRRDWPGSEESYALLLRLLRMRPSG